MTQGTSQALRVRLHHLDVLARRADAAQGAVQVLLQRRLQQAQLTYQAYLACLEAPLPCATAQATARSTGAAAALRSLTQQWAQPSALPEAAGSASEGRIGLRSLRQSQRVWSRLSAERQLAQALQQAPRNAGPINSHGLVLRSLVRMQAASPDYLGRFLSYVDGLLSLDAGHGATAASAKPDALADSARKSPPRVRRRGAAAAP